MEYHIDYKTMFIKNYNYIKYAYVKFINMLDTKQYSLSHLYKSM